MFFFRFLCSGTLDLALGILKMLNRDMFSWYLTTNNLKIYSWHEMTSNQFVQ